jgi:cytochrome c peroxidase
MRISAVLWLALAALALPAPAREVPPFSEGEVKAILEHGPWPVPIRADPGNRVSGKREAIEFGERLFFDRRISGNGQFSCGTCHIPERNWTDNRTRGAAIGDVERNTPTLMNVRLGKIFGWDGAADALWKQSIRPILNARELGASERHVAELVRSDAQFSCRYRKAFGAEPSKTDDQAVLADVGRALAAFQETFETPATPFDHFRDRLARGITHDSARPYSDAARRGLRLFIGKGGCSECHSGPNFSNGELRNNGFAALAAAGRTDPGKDGNFKVPTLRHLFLTAPYGHHGRIDSLPEVVRHYSERGSPTLKPLKLTPAEQTDLVVFLESLSTFNNPWRPDDMGLCH